MKCIYCHQDKPQSDFSKEHIFPKSLGGNLAPKLFITRHVCRHCNSICGKHVDGLFLKTWLVRNIWASEARRFANLKEGAPLPLTYITKLSNLTESDSEVCDLWLSPTGDSIFHLHKESSPDFDMHVGGNPAEAKKYPGRAFMQLKADHGAWMLTTLNSVDKHFSKTKTKVVAINFWQSSLSGFRSFVEPTLDDQKVIHRIFDKENYSSPGNFSTSTRPEQRFLCKLALGIGFQLFGDEFTNSMYASILRKGLWQKNNDSTELPIRGIGFFSDRLQELRFLSFKGALSISLFPIGNELLLSFALSDMHVMSIVVTDQFEEFQDIINEIGDCGTIHIVAPQLKKWIGPLPIESYLAHKLRNFQLSELSELEAMAVE